MAGFMANYIIGSKYSH